MKRFLYAACLLFLGSVSLRAAEPETPRPVLDTLDKSVRITREAIYLGPARTQSGDPMPVCNTCRFAVQTSARVIAFPFVTGYVAISDGVSAVQDRWVNGQR